MNFASSQPTAESEAYRSFVASALDLRKTNRLTEVLSEPSATTEEGTSRWIIQGSKLYREYIDDFVLNGDNALLGPEDVSVLLSAHPRTTDALIIGVEVSEDSTDSLENRSRTIRLHTQRLSYDSSQEETLVALHQLTLVHHGTFDEMIGDAVRKAPRATSKALRTNIISEIGRQLSAWNPMDGRSYDLFVVKHDHLKEIKLMDDFSRKFRASSARVSQNCHHISSDPTAPAIRLLDSEASSTSHVHQTQSQLPSIFEEDCSLDTGFGDRRQIFGPSATRSSLTETNDPGQSLRHPNLSSPGEETARHTNESLLDPLTERKTRGCADIASSEVYAPYDPGFWTREDGNRKRTNVLSREIKVNNDGTTTTQIQESSIAE